MMISGADDVADRFARRGAIVVRQLVADDHIAVPSSGASTCATWAWNHPPSIDPSSNVPNHFNLERTTHLTVSTLNPYTARACRSAFFPGVAAVIL